MKVYRKISGNTIITPALRRNKQGNGVGISVGAIVYRWETMTKLRIVFGFPRNDMDENRQYCDGFELTNPSDVTWFYIEETKPDFATNWLLVGSYPDDTGAQGTQGYQGYQGVNLTDIVLDTSPQLGGNLDVNGKTITSAGGADIPIQPNSTGAVDFGDKLVKQPYFKDVAEVVSAMGANDMDMTVANVFTKTISGATSLTISNPPATGRMGVVTLILTNGGAGVITWPTNTKWPGGTPPTLVASGVDIVILSTIDAGTTWRAQLAQGDSK
jgi:hypothetical protein